MKSGKEMAEVAEEICRFAGLGGSTDREAAGCSRTGWWPTAAPSTRAPTSVSGRCTSRSSPSAAPGPAARRPGHRRRAAAGALRGAVGDRYGNAPRQRIWKRLDDELQVIAGLGYASYFLTVADVTDLIRGWGCGAPRAAPGPALVNYLLRVSGVDPLRHGLLMERFLSPLRQALPDIDVDVESARRLEVYEAILDRYGGERCVAVSMMDTYRVRHAVRDVGAALGMPPGDRRDRQGVPAHPGPRRPARAAGASRAVRPAWPSTGST